MLLTLHNVTKHGAVDTSNLQQSNRSSDNSKSTLAPSIYFPVTLGILVLCRAAFTAKDTASYKLPKRKRKM